MAKNEQGTTGVSVTQQDDDAVHVAIRPQMPWIGGVVCFVGLLSLAAAAFVPSSARHYARGRYRPSLYETLHRDEAAGVGMLIRGLLVIFLAGFVYAILWFVAGVRELRIERDYVIAQPRVGWIPVWPALRVARSELKNLRIEARRSTGRGGNHTSYAIVFTHQGAKRTLMDGICRDQARFVLDGPLKHRLARPAAAATRKRRSRG